MTKHPISPVFDEYSNVLILGSFPSVKSREEGFFYGHPQNRFWKVVAAVYGQETPGDIEEKRKFLLTNHIAVWDVIQSCDIVGSSDSSIKNVTANDLPAPARSVRSKNMAQIVEVIAASCPCPIPSHKRA